MCSTLTCGHPPCLLRLNCAEGYKTPIHTFLHCNSHPSSQTYSIVLCKLLRTQTNTLLSMKSIFNYITIVLLNPDVSLPKSFYFKWYLVPWGAFFYSFHCVIPCIGVQHHQGSVHVTITHLPWLADGYLLLLMLLKYRLLAITTFVSAREKLKRGVWVCEKDEMHVSHTHSRILNRPPVSPALRVSQVLTHTAIGISVLGQM